MRRHADKIVTARAATSHQNSPHKSRDLSQGPRLAIPGMRNNPRWLSCGGAGYCPRVRKVYTLAATCVFGDLILAFGLARRRGVPDASPPCVSRSGRKTLPVRKAH